MESKKSSVFTRHRLKQESKKNSGIKKFLLGFMLLIFSIILAIGVFLLLIIKDLPNISEINEIIFAQSSIIYDRNGEELYTIHGNENRKVVPIETIPDNLIQATIAIEDAAFFEHYGFSIKGFTRAVISEVVNFGAHKGGGSTLTQQFVKNTFLSSEKTYTRKIKELILSLQLELKFSKDEILGMYLNSIPYGANSHGAEQASLTFFGKGVADLSLAESTILAALPKAPTFYSPYGTHIYTSIDVPEEEIQSISAKDYSEFFQKMNGEQTIRLGLLPKKIQLANEQEIIIPGRTILVLDRMQSLGFISEQQYENAYQELLDLKFQKLRTEIKAPHFVMYVRSLLEEKYGTEFLNAGGLKIYTTLDYKLQEKAEEIVAEQAEKNEKKYNANNAALISLKPETGEILAMVGSKDYWNEEIDGNVNVILQRRLAGSSFKPFAYAAAYSQGYAPSSIFFDVETDFGDGYIPQNYNGEFIGPVSLRTALGNSLNIPSVKASILGGTQRTYNIAKGMGLSFLKDADHYGSAIALGVTEVRPLDMVQAYGTFANSGKRVEPQAFLKIVDQHGNILESLPEETQFEQVLDEETAYLITDSLADPEARGPGWNSMLQLPGRINAVKTGTSNKRKNEDEIWPLDAWTIGYTPELVTAVWAGNNNGKTMNRQGSGFSAAGPIWRKFMIHALEETEASKFEKPSGIKQALVSSLTGKLPSSDFPKSLVVKDIFSSLNIPQEYDNSLEIIEIESISGDLPNEFTPESAKKKAAVVQWKSNRPWDKNWEDPVQTWGKEYSEEYLKNLGVDDVIAKAPEKTETIHTQKNTQEKPEVSISSPKAFGEVGEKGIGVWLNIQSTHGIAFVDFYLNGELVDTQKSSPYKGNITFPENTNIGDAFTIKAKVYDTLYNAGTSSIQVKVAKDSQAPKTEIVFPKDNQNFSSSSVISVQTYTYDTRSDIARVDFYLNEEKVESVTQSPYSSSIALPKEPGSYTLKVVAYDNASNTAEDSIKIQTSAKKISRKFSVEAEKNIKFGDSSMITFFLPVEDVKELKQVELIARYNSQGADIDDQVLFTTNIDETSHANGIFYYLWPQAQIGDYQLFLRAKYKSGKTLFSAKESVKVE